MPNSTIRGAEVVYDVGAGAWIIWCHTCLLADQPPAHAAFIHKDPDCQHPPEQLLRLAQAHNEGRHGSR